VAAVINLLLNLVVVAVFAVVNHVEPTGTAIWLPLILLEVYIFALGLSLFLSAHYVKYRDISYIWEVILQAGFYLTPIIYPLALITNIMLQKLIMLNPMSQTIQSARYSVVSHQTTTAWQVFDGGWYRFIPFIIVGVVFMCGLLYFKSEARYFAENV
jgi:ABC-2 type transport system permease protein